MKRILKISLAIFVFFLLYCSTALSDEACTKHTYILAGSGNYTPVQISVSDTGHLFRYYADWYCTTGKHNAFLPANDSLYPDFNRPHSYSILTKDLGHTDSPLNIHVYVYQCSINNCTYVQDVAKYCNTFCPAATNKKKPTTE